MLYGKTLMKIFRSSIWKQAFLQMKLDHFPSFIPCTTQCINLTLSNIYTADRRIGCIMDQVKFPNDITISQQANNQLNLDVLRKHIASVIDNNTSGSSDNDSVTPLEHPHAANENIEPLVIQTDANFRGNVGNVDIVAHF